MNEQHVHGKESVPLCRHVWAWNAGRAKEGTKSCRHSQNQHWPHRSGLCKSLLPSFYWR